MSRPKNKSRTRPDKRPGTKAVQPPTAGSARNRSIWLLFPALLAATLLAYQPSWRGGLLWDDNAHITAPSLRSGAGLWRIWSDISATQQYYPVTHSAFWLMSMLWGDRTAGYHLANILLHALSAFLLVLILRRLSIPGAYFAGMIFALHPVFVESVAWISELKNTLSGVLCLAAALAYLEFDSGRKRRLYAASLVLFILALLAKSVTATLPAALLVVFWWRRGTLRLRRDVVPLLPFLAAAVAAGMFTAWVERSVIGAEGESFGFTLIERCLIAGRAVWFYLGKLFWPADLIFLYPRWQIDAAAWPQYLYPFSLAVALAALWWLRGRTRAPLAAMLVFGGMLLPAIGFFNVYPFVFSFVADHFQYLASIAVITLFAAGATAAARSLKPAWAPPAGALVLGIALALLTWCQSRQYTDAETLYRATIGRNPASWLARNNLASLLLARSKADITDAVAHLQEAIRLKPDYAGAWMNLGNAWRTMGRYQDALAAHEKAVALNRNIPAAHANLGLTLVAFGRRDEAIGRYHEAIRLKPDFAEPHLFLGEALLQAGRLEEAASEVREALRLHPAYPEACNALANVTLRMGRIEEAIAEYRKALSYRPGYAAAHTNLGTAYALSGRIAEAVAQHQEALRLRPDFAEAHLNLGKALQAQGRLQDSVAQFRETLRLHPADPEAVQLLGAALQKLGRPEEALRILGENVRDHPDSAPARAAFAAALLARGQAIDALAQYQEALRLQPGAAPLHYQLGIALQSLGRHEEAIPHYREALGSRPDDAEAHNALGAALASRGRLEEAFAHFQEALKIEPDYAGARANLARAAALLGRPVTAPAARTGK